MRREYWVLLPLLLYMNSHAFEPSRCASTISELKGMLGDQEFPLKWEEKSMDDGRPLVVSILEKDGSLVMEFNKTHEGLWAESVGTLCKAGRSFETKFSSENFRFGPAASFILRYALRIGGKFTLTRLDSEQVHIATVGWHGIFRPVAP
ncbi:MAG: hypothetical protein D4S02_01450 [Rhodocyclaceae bacterium]|nr:MAG: hypothetical protein D4S02_01450 [Rhodocyclaceae bacterium]